MQEWIAGKNEEFIYHYQQTLFRESNSSQSDKSKLKKQSLYQILQVSNRETSNETTCHILRAKLQEYSTIVDKFEGVNNYASGVLDLVSHSSCENQKWVSQVNVADLLATLPPSKGDCCNKTSFGCGAQIPTKSQLEIFLKDKTLVALSLSGSKRQNTKSIPQQQLTKSNLPTKSFPTYQHNKTSSENNNKSQFNSHSKIMNTIESRVFKTSRSVVSHQPSIPNAPSFRTAGSELKLQNARRFGQKPSSECSDSSGYGSVKKSLGGRTRSVNSKFVPPVKANSQEELDTTTQEYGEEDERLRLIDPKMVDLIRSEIMDHGPPVHWDDIAGLLFAKATIQEIVVLPMLRPDIFTGLRSPPKGILLFGPPGTGKTLIGKCIASQSHSTFFNISASSLTSKWVGEGEKMVRTLFTLARVHQPAVVFIDEIDSLLSQRSETEHESSRRIKTEFLVQLDGAGTGEEERILVIGATNRPQELDEAARRRFVKRLYIPLPDHPARCQIIQNLMSLECHKLSGNEIEEIATQTEGYSGADMKTLCQEASLGPIRTISFTDIQHITADQVRPITVEDFKSALSRVRSSVSPKDLETYIVWDQTYGSGGSSKS